VPEGALGGLSALTKRVSHRDWAEVGVSRDLFFPRWGEGPLTSPVFFSHMPPLLTHAAISDQLATTYVAYGRPEVRLYGPGRAMRGLHDRSAQYRGAKFVRTFSNPTHLSLPTLFSYVGPGIGGRERPSRPLAPLHLRN
jgi:hypothetical protein